MPRLFAPKFVCFYCNLRSAQDRKAGVQQWQCEQCDAVNHLDEHGEITDPPVPSSQSPLSIRYVKHQPPLLSARTNLPDRSLFCPRCLQNQHIVNQALAEYLPSQDDPAYSEFEHALPTYRKKMEERFPQVCDNCAPAVDDRIRSTGYAAKTDHLRRMMDRTRGQGAVRKSWSWSWSWKSLVVMLGGIGWTLGLVVHLAFHIRAAIPTTGDEDDLLDPNGPRTMVMCLLSGASNLWFRPSCNQRLHASLGYGLALSLLCCWWNPKIQFKLNGGYGRVVGRVHYYKLQLVALAVRFVSWKLAVIENTLTIDAQTLYVLSWRSIQIDQRPQVSFQEHYEPLMPARAKSQIIPPSHARPRDLSPASKSRVQRFPLEKLASQPLLPQQLPYQPPTPPPDEGDQDTGMDWTPQHNFRPAKEYNTLQPQAAFHEPSPFHGALPPAPVSWAQRLRNPTQPAFLKASNEKKEIFFGKQTKRIFSDDASEVSSQFSPKSQSFMSGMSSPVKFAPPRFFAPADRMETGLESLFEDTFTLHKETKSSNDEIPQRRLGTEMSSLASSPMTRLATTILLSTSCVAWEFAANWFPASVPEVRSICQILAASISGLNAASSAALSPTTRSVSSALFYGLEATAAAALSGLIWQPLGHSAQIDIRALGLWFLIVLTLQEVWHFSPNLVLPAPTNTGQEVGDLEPEHEDAVTPKPKVQQQAVRGEARRRPFNQAAQVDRVPAFSTNTKSNHMHMSQRRTRSKTRNEGRRDSLGVNGLGSLSLGGW
ncbi:MAG: hypothetical protein Q9204_002031 [Flavoplaca sp. TL-2023a]